MNNKFKSIDGQKSYFKSDSKCNQAPTSEHTSHADAQATHLL